MQNPIERIQTGPKCSKCNNFARRGQDTCRWHDPVVLAARATELERQAAELRASISA